MQACVTLVFFLFTVWINAITGQEDERALYPAVANVARRAAVTTNATCGENRSEFYCRLIQGEFMNPWESQYCFVCDALSPDDSRKHPIENVIDGGEAWWQSPSLAHGMKYDYVTITLDLKQVYQVSYVNVEVGLSPRPGNWILEKSLDGITFEPWQYFAITDADCWLKYGTPPVIGWPKHLRDNQVICTSHFSRIDPLQNGTVFVSLVRGRVSEFNPSQTLLNFMSAQYLRLRFQKLQKLNNDEIILMMNRPDDVDGAILRRYFYTIKEISVGAQCECHGHASRCTEDAQTGEPICVCEHNTCGATCDMCCPKYNQKPWQPGLSEQEFVCEECNCNGHSVECEYNETVAKDRLSNNMNDIKHGGGVCVQCRDNTEGINCEHCVKGYYRPQGASITSPCRRCQCHQIGSTGECLQDDARIQDGQYPGDCVCKEEYTGSRCERCAPGHRDYPWCQKCPCNQAGSQNKDICAECLCKANVEGRHCDQCLPGHYHLTAENSDGCSPCFCFGVTSQCDSLSWGKSMVKEMSDWQVKISVSPSQMYPGYAPMQDRDWLVYQGPALVEEKDPLYWVAPSNYLGEKLYSYGGVLEYTLIYETSGFSPHTHHLADADVLLLGEGVSIGKRGIYYRENQETVVTVNMTEKDWFKRDASGYLNQPITKADFMMVLTNLKGLFIRASYHTGQTLTKIKDVKLEVAMETGEMSDEPMRSVEKCVCPPGYTGMSCEKCEAGYRRVNNTLMGGECLRCECHGQATDCDPVTGKCLGCEENTGGDHCEKCRGGFYGDPTRGDTCKPCACPLVEASNNFAMDCVLNEDNSDYICIGCQYGHVGRHCELCDDGFFGNPLVPGNFCQPCECNNNIDLQAVGNCDTRTGECLKCLSDTEGLRCERCKPGFFGTAENGDCHACNCNLTGSENRQCDQMTGQCVCKPHYTGQYCDLCEVGFGNIEAGCLPCNCGSLGSNHEVCDPLSGQCDCRAGVTGLSCDVCRNGFYGLSAFGCQECGCDITGSNSSLSCHPDTGQCRCLPHVTGQRCEECENSYWNLSSAGCQSCDCNEQGSWDRSCDPLTGQCSCKDGVEGPDCSVCKPGHYGFSHKGCRECARCKSEYHVCDPETGQCVCPPNTEGAHCQSCSPKTWGHDPVRGCKPCECHKYGSVTGQCDRFHGQCQCKDDYMGLKCDQCQFGYYGFPQCRPCLCNANGTSRSECDGSNVCQCDERGICPCKSNVEGKQCDECKLGFFGLHAEAVDGCSECFCFGKTTQCSQASYFWNKLYGEDRKVGLNGRSSTSVIVSHGLNIIPPQVSDVNVPSSDILRPIYWTLPHNFTGDKMLSYRGRLEFRILYNTPVPEVDGSADWGDDGVTFTGTMAVLKGRGMVLEHHRSLRLLPNEENTIYVTLSEENWSVADRPDVEVTKRRLLTVLSSLEEGYILAAPSAYNYYVRLKGVFLDVASEDSSTGIPANGIEMCQCPSLYSGLSCQLPGAGYYRDPHRDRIDWSNLVNISIGMRPCDCNNHSQTCDPYTGECQNCLHHTVGSRCENCIRGFYGNSLTGKPDSCQRCGCPLQINSNNFSPTCRFYGEDYMCTECSEGTRGTRCESCLPGYYGDPTVIGDRCKPCACNLDGSLSRSCDQVTGQCQCRPGLHGRSCDQCRPRHALIGGRCIPCDDGCAGKLMAELDLLDVSLDAVLRVNLTDLPPPILRAEQILNITRELQVKLADADRVELSPLFKLVTQAEDNVTALITWAEGATNEGGAHSNKSLQLMTSASETEIAIKALLDELQVDVESLDVLVDKLLLNGSGVNISITLPHARDLLTQIQKDKSFTKSEKAANKELGLAKETSQRVNGMDKLEFNVSALELTLQNLRDQLNDLQDALNKSAENQLTADALNHDSKRVYNRTQILQQFLEGNLTDLNSVLEDGKFYYTESDKVLAEALVDLEMSEKKLDILRTVSDQLNVKGELIEGGLESSEQLVNQSWEHAYQLYAQAQTLNSTFSGTRTEAVDPLQAATVYKKIVQAVENAQRAASKAVDEADHTLTMAKNKTLQRAVVDSVDRSDNLAQEETEIVKGISDLQDRLGYVSEDLIPVERKLNKSEEELKLIERQKNRLGEGFDERVKELDEELMAVIQSSNSSREKANMKVDQVAKELIPILLKVHPEAVLDKLGYNINQTVEASQQDLLRMENLTTWLNTKLENVSRLKSDLASKILALKDKIKLARAEANNVKASLSAAGNCVRSYRTPDHAGTSNSLSFNFKTNSTDQDMLLFLLQNSPHEYMAVEMNSGKIQFSWNVGGGPGRVIHPEPIQQTLGEDAASERWYRVEVQRIGRLALLKVKSMFGLEALSEDVELSGTSPPGLSLLTFGNSSHLYVSGVPSDYQTPDGVTNKNFTGCIGNLFLDDHRIGLFNFRQTSGFCSACVLPPSLSPPVSGMYQFDGAGYAALPGFEPYSSTRYVISLEFKTIWENALLFLSTNPETGDYLSLEMRDGQLMFQFYLGGNSLGILTSKRQYNLNEWVSVTAGRQNLRGLLEVTVKKENDYSETINGLALPGNNGLELMDRTLYFGGIPDSLYLPRAPYISRKKRRLSKRQIVERPGAIDVETSPFLGCMRSVQAGSKQLSPLDLLEGDSVGVTEGCSDAGQQLVGFHGDGFVELEGYSLSKGSADVSLTFTTLYPEGVLLLATGLEPEHFYSLALVNGLLQARISAGSGVVVLTAEKNYTDGQPHNVALMKYDRDVELMVDDALVEVGELPVGSGEIRIPSDSGLFVGGVPSGIDTQGKVGTSKGLHGCITDIVINRGLVLLNKPVTYKLADIGRCSAAALTSVFAPTVVTRRPSVWPGLGTSQTRPYPGFTKSPSGTGTPKAKTSSTTPGITEATTRGKTKPQTISPLYPWQPSPVTTTSKTTSVPIYPPWIQTSQPSEKATSMQTTTPTAVYPPWFVTKKPPYMTTTDLTTTGAIYPPWFVTRQPSTSAATTTERQHISHGTGPPIGIVPGATTEGSTSRTTSPHVLGPGSSSTSTFPGRETSRTSAKIPDVFVTPVTDSEVEMSTSTGYSTSPVLISGQPTELTTGEGVLLPVQTTTQATGHVTEAVIPGESSGEEVNETVIIIPGGDRERSTTKKMSSTGVWTERPASPTEPDLIPKTAHPQESGTAKTTTSESPFIDGVTHRPTSAQPKLESSIPDMASEQITTPTILVATISVTPGGTEIVPTSVTIEPTTTRIAVLPTSVQPFPTTTGTTTTVPSVTIVGVPVGTRSTSASATTTTTTVATTTTTAPAPTLPPTSCAFGDDYDFEDDSISFGNTRSSYAEIDVRKKAVRKDFNITFEFRSFSPDGMFFYLTNGQQTHFVSGQLKDGKVVITYNDRRGSPLRIKTADIYSDGDWHMVHVEKGQREISLEVDKSPVLRAGIPRRLNVTAPMYVGGLPRNYKLREGLVAHSVRGCLRRFVVNGGLFQLKNASVVSGVGPCYSKVENGAYFSGYSYGVFDRQFSIGNETLIILSFRTHKTDGILLTVSSSQGTPAMTLELHEGKLKFSMRSDDGVFTAETQYDTEFALCDQRWHVVKAEVIWKVLTLRVDDGNVIYAFGSPPAKRSRHPLFIGGFPAYARPQGASYSQINFEGCMKNVFINGIPVDWYNLVQSVEINKVSCPLL